MAVTAISIRNLDPEVIAQLRVRAPEHGRSMEAEVRAILVDAVSDVSRPVGLFDAIRAISLEHGGVDLELPHRKRRQRPIELSSLSGWLITYCRSMLRQRCCTARS
jgi:antitoxin FitA